MNASPTIFTAAASVLIIKPRAIGDVLLSTPVIRNLKRAAPQLEIDFLTERFASDVVRGNPAIREVLTFSKKDDSTLSVIRTVRQRRYDIVIDLFGNPRTALITRFSGARRRIGFPFRGRAYAYTDLVTPRGGEVHNVDFNLDVLRHFGVPIEPGLPEFPLGTEHRGFAEQWLKGQGLGGKRLIGVNASGGWYTKKWNPEGFAALTDMIAKNHGLTPLLFWGPGEEKDVRAIAAMMQTPAVLIPPTSLKQMGALLSACSYLISNDSGPMHIAAALGVPTLGIFGPTSPQLQGPYGSIHHVVRHEDLDCLECNLTECPIGNICMKELPVNRVYIAFQQLLQSQR